MSPDRDPLPELVGFLETLGARLRHGRCTREEAARLIGYQLLDPRLVSARHARPLRPDLTAVVGSARVEKT